MTSKRQSYTVFNDRLFGKYKKSYFTIMSMWLAADRLWIALDLVVNYEFVEVIYLNLQITSVKQSELQVLFYVRQTKQW